MYPGNNTSGPPDTEQFLREPTRETSTRTIRSINISEIKFQISDRKIGRINIEEAFAYENPAIIFEDGLILDEETGFTLYAYVLSRGDIRLCPIGFQLNRVPNKLMTTNTGAALL